jgi:hypothetical protein
LVGTPSTPGLNGNGVALTAGWYAYTPTSNGILNINSCGGGADTRLWVWSGSCGALTPVANNDDFAGCISTGTTAYASKIENIIVTTGNTYYFEWDNQWEATGFTWNFTFTALPMNNDAGITYVTNRYTRVPITQASAGIPFGATVNNFSGSALTNVVLTTEIFELPNTTTPVQTLTSTPVTLAIGASQVISCGTWAPVLTASKSYLVKYTKTQTQIDGVTSNDVTTQNLTLDFNYYARDNNTYLTGYNWSSTNFTWKQGNFYNFYGADNVTGVAYYVASSSTTQAYNILVYSVTNGVVSTNPVYTGPSITANGAGWKYHTFTTPLAVTAGSEFLFVVNHAGTAGFALGVSSATHTAGKSVIKVGTGAWTSTETYGVNVVFVKLHF